MTSVRTATRFDEGPAIAVWQAALAVRGRPPGLARTAQVRATLRAPDTLALVADDDGAVVGMLLAELGRDDDGAGAVLPGVLHLSMLFVRPDVTATTVGSALLDGLTGRYPAVLGWVAAEDALLPAYEVAGFTRTGRTRDDGALLELAHH